MKFETTASMVQTKMTNADKTIREDMGKEAANELEDMEGQGFLFAIIAVIEIFEGDSVFANRHNTMVRNSNTEDVATEILDQLFFVIERLLDIDFPIFGQGLGQHGLNIELVMVSIEFAVSPEFGKFKAEAVAKLIGKQEDREKELVVSGIPRIASGGGDKRAARHDEVEVKMLLHGLPPGVHDHRKADLTAKIFLTELLQ